MAPLGRKWCMLPEGTVQGCWKGSPTSLVQPGKCRRQLLLRTQQTAQGTFISALEPSQGSKKKRKKRLQEAKHVTSFLAEYQERRRQKDRLRRIFSWLQTPQQVVFALTVMPQHYRSPKAYTRHILLPFAVPLDSPALR